MPVADATDKSAEVTMVRKAAAVSSIRRVCRCPLLAVDGHVAVLGDLHLVALREAAQMPAVQMEHDRLSFILHLKADLRIARQNDFSPIGRCRCAAGLRCDLRSGCSCHGELDAECLPGCGAGSAVHAEGRTGDHGGFSPAADHRQEDGAEHDKGDSLLHGVGLVRPLGCQHSICRE